MPVNCIIDLLETQESARDDASFKVTPEAAAISQHKRQQKGGSARQKKGDQPPALRRILKPFSACEQESCRL